VVASQLATLATQTLRCASLRFARRFAACAPRAGALLAMRRTAAPKGTDRAALSVRSELIARVVASADRVYPGS